MALDALAKGIRSDLDDIAESYSTSKCKTDLIKNLDAAQPHDGWRIAKAIFVDLPSLVGNRRSIFPIRSPARSPTDPHIRSAEDHVRVQGRHRVRRPILDDSSVGRFQREDSDKAFLQLAIFEEVVKYLTEDHNSGSIETCIHGPDLGLVDRAVLEARGHKLVFPREVKEMIDDDTFLFCPPSTDVTKHRGQCRDVRPRLIVGVAPNTMLPAARAALISNTLAEAQEVTAEQAQRQKDIAENYECFALCADRCEYSNPPHEVWKLSVLCRKEKDESAEKKEMEGAGDDGVEEMRAMMHDLGHARRDRLSDREEQRQGRLLERCFSAVGSRKTSQG